MSNYAGAVNLITAVLGLVILAAAIFVAFRGSYNKARIEALREDNNDLRQRVMDLEGGRRSDHEEITTLKGEVAHFRDENELLKEMVLQRADVDMVGQKLDDHHREVVVLMTGIRTLLEEVASHGR